MHIMGGTTKAAFRDDNNLASELGFDLTTLHARISSTLTWPRKAETARQLWNSRCLVHNLPPKLPPAAVPTRPTSKVELYEALLKYSKVVDDLYNPNYNSNLVAKKKSRRLSDEEWDQISTIVDAMLPVKVVYYKQQSEGFWGLSDSVAATLRLFEELAKRDVEARTRQRTERLTPTDILGANINLSMMEYLNDQLLWVRTFQPQRAASMLSLMLDHRFKTLRLVSTYFRATPDLLPHLAGKPPPGVVEEYSDLLLKLAADVCIDKGSPVVGSVQESELDIFRMEVTTEPASAAICNNELDRFRKTPITPEESEMNPLVWWPKHKDLYPHLYLVARAIFTIPGSQNDVERLFSIAGYLSSHRRNGMSVDMLEELAFINRNYPGMLEEWRLASEEDDLSPEDISHLMEAMKRVD
jgi:hypothetical protein